MFRRHYINDPINSLGEVMKLTDIRSPKQDHAEKERQDLIDQTFKHPERKYRYDKPIDRPALWLGFMIIIFFALIVVYAWVQ